jgi:hypothetical protein
MGQNGQRYNHTIDYIIKHHNEPHITVPTVMQLTVTLLHRTVQSSILPYRNIA